MHYLILFSQAGIRLKNMTIVLEPEAVSMYCQYIRFFKEDASYSSLDILKSGTEYMVVDLGGNCSENQIWPLFMFKSLKLSFLLFLFNICNSMFILKVYMKMLVNCFNENYLVWSACTQGANNNVLDFCHVIVPHPKW